MKSLQRSTESSLIFSTIPKCEELKLSNNQWIIMVKKLLGIELVDVNTKCICNQIVDAHGSHLIHDCCHGDERFDTHDGVQEQIMTLAQSCGLRSIKEQKASLSLTNRCRADVSIFKIPKYKNNVLVDIAITNTHNKSANKTKDVIAGNAVSLRSKAKISKYKRNHMISQDQTIIPIVIDSYGLINQEGVILIKDITKHGEDVMGIPAHRLFNYWIKRILVAAHKGMGNALIKRSYKIINNTRSTSFTCHPNFMVDVEYVRF
jgi:hypothetical protein